MSYQDQAAGRNTLCVRVCIFTSWHQAGLDASHEDSDHSAVILSWNDFYDSLENLDVGIIYVATAVIIHSGHSETVAEDT